MPHEGEDPRERLVRVLAAATFLIFFRASPAPVRLRIKTHRNGVRGVRPLRGLQVVTITATEEQSRTILVVAGHVSER